MKFFMVPQPRCFLGALGGQEHLGKMRGNVRFLSLLAFRGPVN